MKDDIIRLALAQKHMGEAIPKAWLTFEEKLLSHLDPNDKGTAMLMFDSVDSDASSCGIYDPEEIDEALQFLTDLGTIQYFRTDFLKDRVIIDPQWIVDVMACVVSVKKTGAVNDGRLSHVIIPKVWRKYPPHLHQWLLKLTETFDLTFPIKNEATSIVPCLLPEQPAKAIEWPSLLDNPDHRQTRLVFSFKYLPTGLFNRVQVRLCQFSDEALIWRRGSLLTKNQNCCLLTQPNATSIDVKVQGPCPENIAFLIMEVVDTLIYEAFQGVQPDYLSACPTCVDARMSDPSMFERSRVRRAFELKIQFLQCWNYFHSVSTTELRQLFPAESSAEFDEQFSRTVQDIANIRKKLKIDILLIGCSLDGDSKDLSKYLSTKAIGEDIEKSFKNAEVVVIPDPDKSSDASSFDQLFMMMRTARLVIFCLSDMFMKSDRCQSAFFTCRETLKKDILMVFVRDFDFKSYPSLAFVMTDDVFIKATNKDRYKTCGLMSKIQKKLSHLAESDLQIEAKKYPEVFISYSWYNSSDAVNKGTKAPEKALGVIDPREIKRFISDNGFDCWLDIEQVGLGGLFHDIALGIKHAKVVVVCVSDEYTKSENCKREFNFATTSCRIPIVLCPVGTGCDWQTSEINLVAEKAHRINFQVDLKENFDLLLKVLTEIVQDQRRAETGHFNGIATGDHRLPKTKHDFNKTEPLGNQKQNVKKLGKKQSSLVLHEMIELGQRKFLRQLISYIDSGTRSMPRLLIVDVNTDAEIPSAEDNAEFFEELEGETCEVALATDQKEDDSIVNTQLSVEDGEQDALSKLRWSVCFLCEYEGGWHPSNVKIPLPLETGDQIIHQSADYFGQIFSFIRHLPSTGSLELLTPKSEDERYKKLCKEALTQLEKMANPDQNFDDDYLRFRDVVLDLAVDQTSANGGLKKCQLALGKELWLCSEHQMSASKIEEDENKRKPKLDSDAIHREPTIFVDPNLATDEGARRVHRIRPAVETKKDDPDMNMIVPNSRLNSATTVTSTTPGLSQTNTTSRACTIQ